jgi:UDP-N-acetylmuramate--alanine ligase
MLKARFNDVTILDDYAHHPTEIKASLSAIRQKYAPKRLWCIFQPHQYSRTRFLLDDFAESFKLADITVVPDIYFVRDTAAAQKQVNSQVLVERICSSGSKALFIDGSEKICEHLTKHVTAGDLIVTMGAGDIWKVADEYIYWLSRDS